MHYHELYDYAQFSMTDRSKLEVSINEEIKEYNVSSLKLGIKAEIKFIKEGIKYYE